MIIISKSLKSSIIGNFTFNNHCHHFTMGNY